MDYLIHRSGAFAVAVLIVALAAGCEAEPAPPPAALDYISDAQPTEWPIRLQTSTGTLDVFQPQPETFQGNTVTARAAVSLTRPGNQTPVFGTIWISARVLTDRDTRTVTVQSIAVRRIALPNANDPQQKQFADLLRQDIPSLHITCSLDELMTSLQLAQRERSEAEELQTTPPRIYFTTTPATLVTIEGEPKLQAVGSSPVMRVVNTPFIILRDPAANQYFLRAGTSWMTAPAVLGPWVPAGSVPAAVLSAAQAVAPPQTQPTVATAAATQPASTPRIIVTETPAALIATDGASTYAQIPNSELSYVNNTQSDVFFDRTENRYYVVLSGRWYLASSLQGPWEYVASDKLPAAFSKIPANSPKADVLPFVAGTMQAEQALLDASIPQTAAIRRDSGSSLHVTYDGEPQFDPIEGTQLTYAVNSPQAVIHIGYEYYCCDQAVWYVSPTPVGPWTVAVSVPPEIYAIPPSNPLYNVRYVSIYDYDPQVVYEGYLPGYTGSYVFGPTVVYGTGYFYPGWYGALYVPRPWTYGFDATYDFWTGTWGFGLGYWWGPTWFVGGPWRHGWWGPGGFHDFHHFRDSDHRFHDFDHRGDARINIYHRPGNEPHNFNLNAPRSGFGRAASASDVYAGHDGRVYRRTGAGWEEHTAGGWNRMNSIPEERLSAGRSYAAPPRPSYSAPAYGGYRGLEADHFARQQGAFRANSFGERGGFGGRGGGFGGGFGGRGGGGGGRR